jgi:ribosomal-protein-alanine N-acetyltransferase
VLFAYGLKYEMTPSFETIRLLLRPLRRQDAARIQEVFPRLEIVEYLNASIPWPYPPDGAEQFLDFILPQIEAGSRFVWAITLGGELIGLIDLDVEGPFHRGFWLIPEHHKNGYMTEAVTAVNDFAFDVLKMPLMRLGNAVPNAGSRRIKEKSVAVLVDVIPDVPFVGGVFPEEVWELTAEAWRENRDQFRHSQLS